MNVWQGMGTLSKADAADWNRLLTAARDAQFSELVERQSRFVFRVAYALLRNVADAEDVTQEAFLKVFRSGAWHDLQDEKAYLARVAWRLAATRRKSTPAVQEHIADRESAEASPEADAIQSNLEAVVHRLVERLPEKLRQPLALLATEELSSPEIARVMGIPEGTVRRRIMQARLILREKLERRGQVRHG